MINVRKAQPHQAGITSLHELIIDCITDIKGKNITLLDLRGVEDSPADYFIICEGDSTTQVRAMATNIERRLRSEQQLHPGHVEGAQHGKWICMDYYDTVVHIFYPETRKFYDLEQLWGDAARIDLEIK